MLTRRDLAVTTALVSVLLATGCGPADKQAAVRDVQSAADHLGIRTGTLSMTIERGAGAPAVRPVALDAGSLPATVGLVLDSAHHAAALVAPPGTAMKLQGKPLAIFEDSIVYSRTADGDVVGARPWYRLNTAHLGGLNHDSIQDLLQPTTLGDLVVLNPLTILEQAKGMLTGSVHIDRHASVTAPRTGTPEAAIQVTGNTSLDKVARQLHRDPDSERPVRSLLGIYAATHDVNPISIWLSPSGALLRLRISYTAQPQKRVHFHVVYDLTLDPPAASTTNIDSLEAPRQDDVVDVDSLGQLSLALATLGHTGAHP